MNRFLNFSYNNTNLEQFLKENKYDEIVVTLEEQASIYLQKIIKPINTKNDE